MSWSGTKPGPPTETVVRSRLVRASLLVQCLCSVALRQAIFERNARLMSVLVREMNRPGRPKVRRGHSLFLYAIEEWRPARASKQGVRLALAAAEPIGKTLNFRSAGD